MVRLPSINPRNWARAFILFSVIFPAVLHAEVMDKEFSLNTLLATGIFGTLLAFLVARYKPWLMLVFLPVTGLFFASHIAEIMDPGVGPAMAAEAGRYYIYISWTAPALVLLGGSIGFALRHHILTAISSGAKTKSSS